MISKAKTRVLSIKTGSVQSGLEDSAISVGNGGEWHQAITGDHPALTTNQRLPISDNPNSLRANPTGPTPLEDFILREKITHFDEQVAFCPPHVMPGIDFSSDPLGFCAPIWTRRYLVWDRQISISYPLMRHSTHSPISSVTAICAWRNRADACRNGPITQSAHSPREQPETGFRSAAVDVSFCGPKSLLKRIQALMRENKIPNVKLRYEYFEVP